MIYRLSMEGIENKECSIVIRNDSERFEKYLQSIIRHIEIWNIREVTTISGYKQQHVY